MPIHAASCRETEVEVSCLDMQITSVMTAETHYQIARHCPPHHLDADFIAPPVHLASSCS